MSNYLPNKKGVAIFMVLATIMIVVVLANVVLAIISNQSRLTRHEVNRIQAYYSAQAALVYTLEKIRMTGGWPATGGSDRYYCSAQSSGGAGVCIDSVAPDDTIGYDRGLTRDGTFHIQVKVYANNTCNPAVAAPPAGVTCLDAKVDYSYIP